MQEPMTATCVFRPPKPHEHRELQGGSGVSLWGSTVCNDAAKTELKARDTVSSFDIR